MLDALVAIHPGSADWAFDDTRQKMHLGVLATVHMFILFSLRQQLDLCFVPEFFRHNPLMQAVHQQIIVLLHKPVIIPGAMHLLRSASAIGDFPTVHRVFQYSPDKGRIEQRIFSVLSLDFVNTMLVKIFGKTICTHVGMHILIEDHTDCSRFFLVDEKLAIFQLVGLMNACKAQAEEIVKFELIYD